MEANTPPSPEPVNLTGHGGGGLPIGTAAFATPDFSPASSFWLEHIPFAFWLVEHAKPSTIVELGVHTGGSYCNFCEAVQFTRIDCRCYGIDNFEGDPHYQNYGPEVLATLKAYHDPRYKDFSNLIKSDFEQALPHFEDGSIDILHIDGTHFYEDVRRDYEIWKPKLSPKGVVLFHDTNVRERDFGVHQLWRELSAAHAGFEFHHCNGLGVLLPGGMPSAALEFLVQADGESAAGIRRFFATLGDRVTRKAMMEKDREVISKHESDDAILRDLVLKKERIAAAEAEAHYKLEQALANLIGERDALLYQLKDRSEGNAEKEAELEKSFAEKTKELADAVVREQVIKERLHELHGKHDAALREIEAAKKQHKENLRATAAEEFHFVRQLQETRKHLKQHWGDASARRHQIMRLQGAAGGILTIQREGLLKLVDTRPPAPILPAPVVKKGEVIPEPPPPPPDEVAMSGLFDEAFYRSQFSEDVIISDPLHHYKTLGWLLGYRPNRLFDPLRYARIHNLPADREPLLDYVTEGISAGRRPHPLFDPVHYRSVSPDLADYPFCDFHHFLHLGIYEGRTPNPLFDTRYYASRSPDVELEDTLDHYLNFGCWEGRDPHPLFDSAYYVREHAFAAAEMENPLLHYLEHGYLAELSPHPLFDAVFYTEENGIDKATAGNLLLHYLAHGLEDESPPHPLFDAARYLQLAKDVRESGINPLIHYCTVGALELRSPHLLFDAEYYVSGDPAIGAGNPLLHFLNAGGRDCPDPHPLFDSIYYLDKYADVRRSRLNPLIHFIKAPPTERRQPHPLFDPSFYLDVYRDVSGLLMNPLSHYLMIGADEGRMPNPYFETAAYRKLAMADGGGGLNPLIHFALCDFDDLKNPGRHFDIKWYLDTYPDVAEDRINPLVHFLRVGAAENRQPCGSSLIRSNLEAKYPSITTPSGIDNWSYLRHRMRRPLTRRVEPSGRRRFNMLFPDLDAQIVFGGYISALEFISAVAPDHDVRLISTMQRVDGVNLYDLRAKFAPNPRISAMLAGAELVDLSDPDATLDVHELDVFCAYSVWDAFLCHQLAKSLGQKEFIYFCQEDEAIFHCNDSLHALARQGQRLPAFHIFNTEVLRNHFLIRRLGVFARGMEEGLAASAAFQHALVDTRPPSLAEMRHRGKIRVLLYARPEDHAKRNLFEITLMGISSYLKAHPEAAELIEFTGVGSMHFDGDVMLTDTIPLHIKPKLSYSDYAKSLAGYDIGISLMYAPHPSILPFEMASAGLIVVTNHYEERDSAVLEAISSNLIAVEPSPDGIEEGLARALERVTDFEGRISGAAFEWSRDWQQSFDADFLEVLNTRITGIIESGRCATDVVEPIIPHQEHDIS